MRFVIRSSTIALALAGMLASGAVLADKGGKGNGKHADKQHHDKQHHDKDKADRHESSHSHFDDRHRSYVRDYYGEQHRRGHCPPGLAKKHNGCMPPGQAKKWHVGQPPAGYRYVRVASDILLMAVGTRMIVDAIQDLGRV